MIRLQTLGAVRLYDGNGNEIRAVVQQPKRLALLAYLAIARPRGAQRRDAIVGMFWAEFDEASARRALSQALYFLRQKIDDGLFAGRFGEEVALSEGAVWCDAVAFETLLDGGRATEALALYTGDLLPGFHISDAPEWEKWLDAERDRLRARAADAAWSLSGIEEAAGNASGAALWARRAVALYPFDEKQHRLLLELLARTGDRGAALRAHDDFTQRLATELEVEPSPETLALVEAIRRDVGGGASDAMLEQATRAIARPPARRHDDGAIAAPGSAPAGEAPTGPAVARTTPYGLLGSADPTSLSPAAPIAKPASGLLGRLWPASVHRWVWSHRLATLALAALAVVASASFDVVFERTVDSLADRRRHAVSPGPAQPLERIAILPFRDLSPGSDLGYFAEGLASTLGDQLAAVEQLQVVSLSSTRQLYASGIPNDSIGRALNVGTFVTGSVSRSGGVLRARVELIDAREPTTLASQNLERPEGEQFALLDDLASNVAWMLRTKLGQEIHVRAWQRETKSVQAWQLVQMSREARERVARDAASTATRETLEEALGYLDEAVRHDPDYARAYVERSRIHDARIGVAFQQGDASAVRVLMDSAEIAATRAVELGSLPADALEQRSHVRWLRWIAGDAAALESAEADARASLAVDPKRPRAETLLSQILFWRGEFQEAYLAASRAYRADAYAERVEDVVWRLFETSFELGNDDEAAKWCDELGRREPESWLQYECELKLLAFGTSGEPDVRKVLHALDAAEREMAGPDWQARRHTYIALLAAGYARSGNADSARSVVERALHESSQATEVLDDAAAAYMQLGDYDRAGLLLAEYVTRVPTHRDRMARSRLFEPLVNELNRERPVRDTR